jgi:hypothetical protein
MAWNGLKPKMLIEKLRASHLVGGSFLSTSVLTRTSDDVPGDGGARAA